MKIAQVVCVYPPYRGGIGSIAHKFNEFLSDDFDTEVFTPLYNHLGSSEATYLKPLFSFGNSAFLPALWSKLKDKDLIIFHYPFFGTTELLWLYKKMYPQKKIIVHFHMDAILDSWFKKILSVPENTIKKSFFTNVDAITCASYDYLGNSSIKEVYKENPKKFHEIGFGVDSAFFIPNKKNKIKNKILFVGGLDEAHYFKGLDFLLEVLNILDLEEWSLDIVGDGGLRRKYEKTVKRLNLTNKVNFFGKVNDNKLLEIYQKSDLFILPSINKSEAFGLVLLEAMACGLPVIASDLPGVRKVFRDGKDGYIFNTLDKFDLKDKIELILNNKDLKREMAISSRELVLNKYSWQNVKVSLESVINGFGL